MTKDNNTAYFNEYIEADQKGKHFEQDLHSQCIHDRDIIRDLEQQPDTLELCVVESKRQNVELQKNQSILKRRMSENEDKYHDTFLDPEAKLKKNVDIVLKIDTEDILDDATKSQIKMKDPIATEKKQNVGTIDYKKIKDLYEDFVPQKELSAKQNYFPSSFISSENSSNASSPYSSSKTKPTLTPMLKITGYGDYVQGNIIVRHVYYAEGLRHNLFSVGQFYNGNLEFAFCSKTCYARNLDGDDLLIKDCESNSYTISISNMAASSPVYLMSKATFTKSWLYGTEDSHILILAEAVSTTCFTKNRSIIHTRHNKTPYELLRGKKPNVEYFHVFGSLCYPTNDRDDLGKLKPKADIGIIIGYSKTSKGFHMYNQRTKKIMETIHVKIGELTSMASEHDSLEPVSQRFINDDSLAESINTSSKEDLDNLFGPMYEEYFEKKSSEMPINSAAQPVHNHEDSPSASSIFIEEHKAPLIVTTSNEQTSPISLNEADEVYQEDLVELDGNTLLIPYDAPDFFESESSTALDPSNMHEFHQNKSDAENILIQNKSRLVANGYKQKEGIDFELKKALYGLKQAPRACSPITRGIFISQSQYKIKLLKKHGMDKCVSMSKPMAIERLDADLQGTPTDQTIYRRMIRGLMYLTASRPDFAFATFVCARYQACPTVKHLKEVKGISRYLRQSYNMGLWYLKDSGFKLIAYSDADHAKCKDDCKSTSEGIQFLEHVEKGMVELYFVGTEYQLADLFTKALPKERFKYLVHRIVIIMAQQQRPADVHQDELCPPNKRYALVDANKKIDLDKPLYPNENKIMANIIQNHPLRFSIAASTSVPWIYLGQFWHTLQEYGSKYRLKFVLDRKDITMTLNYFRRIFYLPQATDNNHERFVAAPKFSKILFFLNTLGFILELRSPSKFKTTRLIQPWQTRGKIFSPCLTTLRIPPRRSKRLTPSTPILTTDEADGLVLQDTLQVSLAEMKSHEELEAKQNVEKAKEHLMAEEIEKLVEGMENVVNVEVDSSTHGQNDNPIDPDTRKEPMSDKESPDELSETDPKPSTLTPSSSLPKSNKTATNHLLSLFKPKTGRFKHYKSFFQELQGRYCYLFRYLKTRFMSRTKFNALARYLQEIMQESLPKMVDDRIKETNKQVPLYVAQELIMERENSQADINDAISNHTPSHVDLSVRNYMPFAIRIRDHDDPQDDAHLEGENDAKRKKTLSMELMCLKNRHDDELPTEKVSQEPVDEMSQTVDEARLHKVDDEMLRQRCTSGDEHQYHIDQMQNFLKNDIVWESGKEIIEHSDMGKGIEKYKMFFIVSEPVYGIIYENNKKEKRVMRHQEIHKFCDATLKRVLEGLKRYNNDVKHGYVTTSLGKEDAEYLQLFL
uniref:Retroviral polymerase SH3-like domain-containing protein n=1 Tax=Tanacetum cinerariifolium TaxID=118510 RepID=A0A6L2L130_TANCI|nr:hypothetical protein [Tanacetum cinerariifolium]